MKSNNIGVSLALTRCFYCGEGSEILINEVLTSSPSRKTEELHNKVVSMRPCSKCEEYMKQGVILISTKDGEEGSKNPYRTGGWAVVKDEVIERMVKPKDLADEILKARFCFVPDQVWDAVGLPREQEVANA